MLSAPSSLNLFRLNATISKPQIPLSLSTRQRPKQRNQRPEDEEDRDIKGLGKVVLLAINSNSTFPQPKSTRIDRKTTENEELKEEEKTQLSGSDVLLALQRASVHKKKKNVKKKRKRESRGLNSDGSDNDDGVDYSNVKPFEVKSDWVSRLNELEKRLKELKSQAL